MLDPQSELNAALPLHDVILFSTRLDYPFNVSGKKSNPELSRPQLWAVSTDGRRASRLADPFVRDEKVVWYFHHVDPPELRVFSATPFDWKSEQIRRVEAPPEWVPLWQPQTHREWVTFLWGSEGCAYRLAVMNLLTQQTWTLTNTSVSQSSFLPNGKLLVGVAHHCEAGSLMVYDPQTGELTTGLSGMGSMAWSPTSMMAVVVEYIPIGGINNALTGYDGTAERVFFHAPTGINNSPIWHPSGNGFLYQHRDVAWKDQTAEGRSYPSASSRQVRWVQAPEGTERVLLNDPAYDYHLCGEGTPELNCTWYGDWIQIRRLPYLFGDREFDYSNSCLMDGVFCSEASESFALNILTGQLKPWDQASWPTPAPSPTPTAVVSAPDLGRKPVYAHPSGSYAFYVGTDNRSLWLVPANGEPSLWVIDGEDFIYIK
ncbi:MAG: hypothetical protein RMK99_14360 [Anaerolineales bacterium]|nr:hypothetical protein [Anaerolineales bacterium]